jgi:hypothetical protein
LDLVAKRDSHLKENQFQTEMVLNSARKLSGYREPDKNDQPVFSGRFRKDGISIEKYYVKGEGDYVIPYLLTVPTKFNGKAIIYLDPDGKSVELKAGGRIEWLAKQGFMVLSPDLIGMGETGPGVFKGDAYIDGESHNLWYASIVIGRSIVGIRAADVSKLAGLLKQDNSVKEIIGIAEKELSPVLLHAASFDKTISSIALLEPYLSYRSIVLNRFYKSSNISGVVPASLTEYDLPMLAGSLAPRRLLIAGPTDGNGKTENMEMINEDLDIIRQLYMKSNAGKAITIVPANEDWKFESLINDWH